jgi:hypothetical protein
MSIDRVENSRRTHAKFHGESFLSISTKSRRARRPSGQKLLMEEVIKDT